MIPPFVRTEKGASASLAEVDLDGSSEDIDIFANRVAMLQIRLLQRIRDKNTTYPLRGAMGFVRIFAGVVVQCSERAVGVHVGMRRVRMRIDVHE